MSSINNDSQQISPHGQVVNAGKVHGRIPSLDGLRAVAIALVLADHAAGSAGFPSALRSMAAHGAVGVRVFFILSGFLITTLLLRELRANGRISLVGFYLRRARRIFPASYTFIGIIALLGALGYCQVPLLDLGHALTYTMNYHNASAFPFEHIWSLSVEEQFYLLWPALVIVAGPSGALRAAFAVVLCVPAWKLAVTAFGGPEMLRRFHFHFEANADQLAIGCLLALTQTWLDRRAIYISGLSKPWFFALVAAIGAGVVLRLSGTVLGDVVLNVLIALVIHRLVRFPRGFVGWVLNLRLVCFLGTISYSLYLWQQAFLVSGAFSFPANLALTFPVALASYYLVERPFLKWKLPTKFAPAK